MKNSVSKESVEGGNSDASKKMEIDGEYRTVELEGRTYTEHDGGIYLLNDENPASTKLTAVNPELAKLVRSMIDIEMEETQSERPKNPYSTTTSTKDNRGTQNTTEDDESAKEQKRRKITAPTEGGNTDNSIIDKVETPNSESKKGEPGKKPARTRILQQRIIRNNSVHSVLLCLMLGKGKDTMKNIQDKKHVLQLSSLFKHLSATDPDTSLLPVESQEEDIKELRNFPENLTSLWRKDLRPYVSRRNCNFGNDSSLSVKIRVRTGKFISPYSLGKSLTDEWAHYNDTHLFHDHIQEGTRVKIGYITNLSDTTNMKELQIDLEKRFNKTYENMRKDNIPLKALKFRIQVNTGTLEARCGNNLTHQAPIGWITVGITQARELIQAINQLNEELYEAECSTEETDSSPMLRITGRNISINLSNPNDTTSDTLAIIHQQIEYFISSKAYYSMNLPHPTTEVERQNGIKCTLRDLLLNMQNRENKATYIFTQVDTGNTIKSYKSTNRYRSKNGVTLTYQSSNEEEAKNAIDNLKSALQQVLTPRSFAEVYPPYPSLSPGNEFSPLIEGISETPSSTSNLIRRMKKLRSYTQSSAVVQHTGTTTTIVNKPLTVSEIRKKVRNPTTTPTVITTSKVRPTTYAASLKSNETTLALEDSFSTITDSQQLTSTTMVSNETQLALFRTETEQALAAAAKQQVDTMAHFREQMIKSKSDSIKIIQNEIMKHAQSSSNFQTSTEIRMGKLETSMEKITAGILGIQEMMGNRQGQSNRQGARLLITPDKSNRGRPDPLGKAKDP